MPTLFTELPVCGIGSLPFQNPQPALELIEKYMPFLPHWPQLPGRGREEHFIYQYLGLLAELGLLVEGKRTWGFVQDDSHWVEGLTAFYDVYLEATAGDEKARGRFAPLRRSAEGLYSFLETFGAGRFQQAAWVKGQVAGPLSVGLNLLDPAGRPAYYDPQLRDLLIKCLSQGAAWQVEVLLELGRPVLVFVDDPGLSAWGTSTYVGLDREAIVEDLHEIVEAIKQAGGMAGAHSCAAIDWSILMDAGFEVLSFDAYGYYSSLLPYCRELEEFLLKGGLLAWGVVPTSEAAWKEEAATLARLWREEVAGLAARGLPPERLRQQSLITPSCGTGVLEPELAARVYQLAGATSQELLGAT